MGFSEHKHLPRYMYIGYVHGYCQIMQMVKIAYTWTEMEYITRASSELLLFFFKHFILLFNLNCFETF